MTRNSLIFNGGPGAIRTPDLLIRSHTNAAEISRFNTNKLHFTARKIKWLAHILLKSVEVQHPHARPQQNRTINIGE